MYENLTSLNMSWKENILGRISEIVQIILVLQSFGIQTPHCQKQPNQVPSIHSRPHYFIYWYYTNKNFRSIPKNIRLSSENK